MEDPIVKKILPHSYEAEQAVIGSMIMDPDAVPIAMELINKDEKIPRTWHNPGSCRSAPDRRF